MNRRELEESAAYTSAVVKAVVTKAARDNELTNAKGIDL